ncbi:hypothetical protein FGIG_12315 [Fasciola gigantica]|uniref:Uncharacterized protein n=1 Tax=Fasciola gigantica TaxID=46835 RepID=A0A504Z4V1_FASGI|nr:hypothetical protein FGIG_12315 [Fasciola gigantica]
MLTNIFQPYLLPTHSHYQRLQLSKRDSDDFMQFARTFTLEFAWFQLGSLIEDQFRCPVFDCGLQLQADADLRTRLLAPIGQNPAIEFRELVNEHHLTENLKFDSALIQQSDRAS